MPPAPIVPTTTFRDSFAALAAGMRWFGGPWGQKWLYLKGLLLDGLWEDLKIGVQTRFPNYVTGESLPNIGHDRQIVRGNVEDNEHYAARLRQWLTAWKQAGTALGMARQLQEYVRPSNGDLPPRIRVVSSTMDKDGGGLITNWWTLEADGTASYEQVSPGNWDWDGRSAPEWSRFWVIFGPGKWTATGAIWGAFNWGDGTLWGGSDITTPELRAVRRIIQQWKGAHTQCGATTIGGGIIITPTDNTFGPAVTTGMPDGTWGDPTHRNHAALYLNGF